MTLESQIVSVCSPFLGGRFYPDIAPLDAGTPYAVYTRVSGQTIITLDGKVRANNARVQLAVWSTLRENSVETMAELENLLVSSLMATPLGSISYEFSPTSKLYGSRKDFSFWW